MICSTCGNPLGSDVRFWPHCSTQKPFQPSPAAPTPAYPASPYGAVPYDRVARNLHTLGILWVGYAGLRALVGLIGVVFLHGFSGSHFGHTDFNLGWAPFGRIWLGSLWPMAIVSILVSVACTVLTGWALLTRQPCGRILAIIFGVFALIHFPVGTALGIYTLWVLAPRPSGDQYTAMAYAQHRG